MKKYLMTGIAAVALCAAFTSCSHDITPMTQEEIDQLEAQKIVNDYEAAFIKAFGQPAANQTWGFDASATRTRGENANANLWYKEYVVPANVTAFEKQEVEKYFTDNTFENQRRINNVDFTDFFIFQVSKGTETYTDGYGNDTGVGSDLTNHLQTYVGGTMEEFDASTDAMTTQNIGSFQVDTKGNLRREHMNDFNRGNNTENVQWDGYNDDEHRTIGAMLMVNSGTADFSFHGSRDNKYHNTYVIIPGEEIHPSLKGYWYVAFDYVATGGYYDENNNLQQGNMQVARDWQFNDWIVRISPAKKIGEEKDPIRVFAEDLTAKADETVDVIDQNSPSDWDFNDVVFDAQYVDATHAKITLWAAGGTLPLRFNEDNNLEVHKLFGVSVKTMVNTHADLQGRSWKDNVQEKVFNITIPQSIIAEKGGNFDSDKYKDNFPLAVRDLIRIEVQKDNRWYELTAAQGKPACKIATPASKVKWLKEKVDIRLGYPNFKQYVGYPSVNWWSGPVEDCLYNVDGNSVQCKVCTNN